MIEEMQAPETQTGPTGVTLEQVAEIEAGRKLSVRVSLALENLQKLLKARRLEKTFNVTGFLGALQVYVPNRKHERWFEERILAGRSTFEGVKVDFVRNNVIVTAAAGDSVKSLGVDPGLPQQLPRHRVTVDTRGVPCPASSTEPCPACETEGRHTDHVVPADEAHRAPR